MFFCIQNGNIFRFFHILCLFHPPFFVTDYLQYNNHHSSYYEVAPEQNDLLYIFSCGFFASVGAVNFTDKNLTELCLLAILRYGFFYLY